MADVTISSLPLGTPSGNNLLPYSTGSSTLGVPASAVLQNAGNIGIGTNTPQQKLSVSGSGGSVFLVNKGTEGNFGDGFESTFNVYQGSSNQIGGRRALTVHGNSDNTYNLVEFYSWANNGYALGFCQDKVGNVGIGTTTPTAKLDVSGDVKSSNTPKAWANFNGRATIGTNQPIRSSYNITSILRVDDNNYEVTFPSGVFTNANYAFIGTSSTSLSRASIVSGPIISAPTTTKFRFCNLSCTYTGQPAGWINESAEFIHIAFFAL